MVSLYINGKKVELADNDFLQVTYTREELINPTIVKNSFSQQITILATPDNETIFKGLFRTDARYNSAYSFDLLARVPFEIRSELNEVLESGYIKVDSIARKGAEIASYTITLYGGLGGYFYSLTYNDDGTKKTLADLAYLYWDDQGEEYVEVTPSTKSFAMTKARVLGAWNRLKNYEQGHRDLWDIINFAPCYNGTPSGDFSADKAVYKPSGATDGYLRNVVTSVTEDNVTYTPRSDANGYVLLNLANEHTEWEVQDLRAYLQRPVLSVDALLRALAYSKNSAGFLVELSDGVQNSVWKNDTWITLPLFDRDNKDPKKVKMSDLLEDTSTPADYLLGLAKCFGWVFEYIPGSKTINVMTRDEFYQNEPFEDLDVRVDHSQEISLNPYMTECRYLDFSVENYGELGEAWLEKKGRNYGGQLVDTAYPFNSDTEDVLDGVVLKGAPMVEEGGAWYWISGADAGDVGDYLNYNLKFAFGEDVSYLLYGTKSGDEVTKDMTPTVTAINEFKYNAVNSGLDFMPRVQLHGADNGSESGEGVLLFYCGEKSFPNYTAGGYSIASVEFHLSDDNDAMLLLNDNKPCWDVSPRQGVTLLSSLPLFSRWRDKTGDHAPDYIFDFGKSGEYYVPGVDMAGAKTPYTEGWQKILADRYDVNTRVLTCYVDLSGLQVGNELLRHRWAFSGAWWVLNKIENYNYGASRFTKCEFIKVNDWSNYHESGPDFNNDYNDDYDRT